MHKEKSYGVMLDQSIVQDSNNENETSLTLLLTKDIIHAGIYLIT